MKDFPIPSVDRPDPAAVARIAALIKSVADAPLSPEEERARKALEHEWQAEWLQSLAGSGLLRRRPSRPAPTRPDLTPEGYLRGVTAKEVLEKVMVAVKAKKPPKWVSELAPTNIKAALIIALGMSRIHGPGQAFPMPAGLLMAARGIDRAQATGAIEGAMKTGGLVRVRWRREAGHLYEFCATPTRRQ